MLPKIKQPVYEYTIPSLSKKVKIRPMLVKEEKLLLIAKQSGERYDILGAIKQVVNNCIITEGINVDDLAIFDLEYLFIKIRSVSISNKTKVSYKDNEDEKVYDFEIDLDKVEVKMENVPSNKIQVNKDILLEMRWPTAAFYSSKEIYEATDDSMFDVLVDACMYKIYEGDKAYDPRASTKEERKEFIDSLPAKTAEEIRAFFAGTPTLYHEITYKNEKGTERKIVLNTLDDFFTL